MANCTSIIMDDEATDIVFLAPNEVYEGDLLNQVDLDYYKYEMLENETMTFNIRIFPQTVHAINVELTLYKIVDDLPVEVGTAYLTEFYNVFNYDGSIGEYRFCMKTIYAVDYELEVEFTDYPFILMPEANAYTGTYMHTFEFAEPEAVECDLDVFYTIIDGRLPPGLSLSNAGWITGTPEEQDCHTPDDIDPSFTWVEQEENGNWQSTTYDYRFVVRAALVEFPLSYADKEFTICVRNNWDYDRDGYVDAMDNFEQQVFIKSQPVGGAVPKVVDDEDTEVVEQLIEPITDERLAELCACVQINDKYAELVQINDEGVCIVCDVIEEDQSNTIELELITPDDSSCINTCDNSDVIHTNELTELMPSMCQCDVESGDIVEDDAPLIEGIPEFCLEEYLLKMRTNRVCLSPIVCPSKNPIFPIYESVKFKFDTSCINVCD